MNDQAKTKAKLIEEISCLNQRINELEQAESKCKRTEEALQETQDLLNEVGRIARIGGWKMDLITRKATWTRGTYDIVEIESDQPIPGPDQHVDYYLPEYRPLVVEAMQALIEDDKPLDFEAQLRTAKGNVKWCRAMGRAVREGGKTVKVYGTFQDITKRKQAEKALENERVLLRNLIDNVPDRIYAKDAEGRFIICNEAMIRRMGMTSMTELVGKSDFDFLPREMAQRFRADELAILQSGIPMINREEPLSSEDGTITRWNLATKVPLLDKQGNTIGIVGIGREITDRKQAEQKLQDTLGSLRKAMNTTIQVMVSAVETRDPYTAGHQTRSADLARSIATEMGLPQEKIDGIRVAGSIHDIGKLSIPAEILSKPTKLSEIEFKLIMEHARQGYEILKDVESSWPLAEMVYQHHERMDGSGYPRHLKGDDILIEARILAVADVVEAMASHRPYRPALGIDAALEEISKNSGVLYDPEVSDACLRLFQEKRYRLN